MCGGVWIHVRFHSSRICLWEKLQQLVHQSPLYVSNIQKKTKNKEKKITFGKSLIHSLAVLSTRAFQSGLDLVFFLLVLNASWMGCNFRSFRSESVAQFERSCLSESPGSPNQVGGVVSGSRWIHSKYSAWVCALGSGKEMPSTKEKEAEEVLGEKSRSSSVSNSRWSKTFPIWPP